jgi:hypothetical protein
VSDINPSTAPETTFVSNPTGRSKLYNFTDGTAVNGRKTAVRKIERMRANNGKCPCACNSGGFCGGCGHSGCGGR